MKLFLVLALFVPSLAIRKSAKHLSSGQTTDVDHPGARAVFSQGALDYLATDLVPMLVEELVPKIKIPEVKADEKGFRIRLYNIAVTNPRVTRPAFRFAPGQGLALALDDIKLDLSLRYFVKGKAWYNPVNTRANARCSPTASASAIVVLGTANGKPTISVKDPAVRISMGKIRVSGSLISKPVQLLLPLFSSSIEKLVQKELMKVVIDLVNKDLRGLIEELDLTVEVPVPPPFDNSGLNLNLTGITAHANHISVDLAVGIMDPRTNRLVRQPVTTVLPDTFDSGRHVSVSMVPEILEDIVRFHQGKWTHTLHTKDMPSESPLKLDTGSLNLLTTPGLRLLWGQKDMQLTFFLDGDAEINFGEGAVDLKLPSAFKFHIKGDDDAEPEHAFTLASPVAGNATVKINPEPEQAILIDVQSLTLSGLSTKESSDRLWFVNTLLINPMVQFLESNIIVPEINKFLGGGIKCCGLDKGKFALRKLDARITQGALAVFADVDVDLNGVFSVPRRFVLQHPDYQLSP